MTTGTSNKRLNASPASDQNSDTRLTWHLKLYLLLPVMLVIGLLVSLPLLWSYSKQFEIAQIRQTGVEQLNLYKSSAEDAAEKYRYLIELLKRNNDIRNALRWESAQARDLSNAYLESIIGQTNIREILLLNRHGQAISSSNWLARYNLIGADLSARPYFQIPNQETIQGIFNIAGNKLNPSYYLSEPVYFDSEFVGNVVVRISLESLQQSWQSNRSNVMITDRNGIIFVSGNVNLIRQTLGVLSSSTINKINTLWSIDLPILPSAGVLKIDRNNDVVLTLSQTDNDNRDTKNYLIQTAKLDSLNAKIHYLSDLSDVQRSAYTNIVAVIMPVLFICILLLFLRERRLKLAQKLAQRDELEHQIEKRTQELKSAQQELIQSSKLAALGTMSAAIVHELNQPITAIRTLSSSVGLLSQQGQRDGTEKGLRKIIELTDYMSSITRQLKVFSRKPSGTDRFRTASIKSVLEASLRMFANQFDSQNVYVRAHYPAQEVVVAADPVKLEQVFVNLLSNALDAMTGTTKKLRIDVQHRHPQCLIRISDSGNGIAEDDLPHLFEPFFTTKQVGEGLGLGLSIAYGIVRELNGTMVAQNHPDGGAVFDVTLPYAEDELPMTARQ